MSLVESKPLIGRSDSRFIQPTLEEVGRVVHVTREMFGPGKSGEKAYQAVISVRDIMKRQRMGEPITDEEQRIVQWDSCSFPSRDSEVRCNGIPTGTVNYDIFGEDEMVLACSREHGDAIEKSIEADLAREGRFTWPARNGWGRA